MLRELGIGLVPFAPLGRGFLTGAVKRAEEYPEGDFRRGDPRYQGENFDANMRAAAAVHEVAAKKGATPGQIALAWLLHKGPDIVPIPGTKRRKYLEENVGAVAIALTRRGDGRARRGAPPRRTCPDRATARKRCRRSIADVRGGIQKAPPGSPALRFPGRCATLNGGSAAWSPCGRSFREASS